MKFILYIAIVFAALGLTNCSSQKVPSTTCFKGRLEVKGICSNYTIKLAEGSIDTARIAAEWKDETTGKSYINVFGLSSPCSFPSTINAGDEFYFVLDTAKQNWPVCMAYYPTPSKKLSIKVLDKPCN